MMLAGKSQSVSGIAIQGLKLTRYHCERGNSADAKSFFSLAQEICENLSGSSPDPSLASTLDELLSSIHYSTGATAIDLNAADQVMFHYSAFNDLRLKIGRQDAFLAHSYNEKGNAYMVNKQYDKGLEAYKKAKEAYEQLPDFTVLMLPLVVANLGLANWFLGDYDAAVEILLKGLRRREEAFGVDDNESFK